MTDRTTADDVASRWLATGTANGSELDDMARAVLRHAAREAELVRALKFYADPETWNSERPSEMHKTTEIAFGNSRFQASHGKRLADALCDLGAHARNALNDAKETQHD